MSKICGDNHNWGTWEAVPAPFGEISPDAQGHYWFYRRQCQTLGCAARQYAQTLVPVGETRIDEIHVIP
jgi:hypothetical protein